MNVEQTDIKVSIAKLGRAEWNTVAAKNRNLELGHAMVRKKKLYFDRENHTKKVALAAVGDKNWNTNDTSSNPPEKKIFFNTTNLEIRIINNNQ